MQIQQTFALAELLETALDFNLKRKKKAAKKPHATAKPEQGPLPKAA